MNHSGAGTTDQIIVCEKNAVGVRPSASCRVGPPELIAKRNSAQKLEVSVHIEDL